MKSAVLRVTALLAAGAFAALTPAEDQSISISSRSFAAIAYSPVTGKYGYAYDHRSRSSAEKAALKQCGADDARIACWVNRGFCALALGNDKSCWGVGWSYGNGANNTEAKDYALEDCRKRTTGVQIELCLSSDGQYIWERSKNTTTITRDGEVILPSGERILPSGERILPSGEHIPPPMGASAFPAKSPEEKK